MDHRHRSLQGRLMGGVAVAAVISLVGGAASAQDAKRYTIPAQPLASALNEFGVQSGQTVISTPELTDVKTSGQVSGETDPARALQALLQGTGLTYRCAGEAYLIVPGPESAPAPRCVAERGAGLVDELIVTAQKREENIQDVPIAISAFSQEDLTRSQIAGGPDLITQVPNMTFTKTNFNSYSIQIRGIGTQAISATTDPAVAVAFNNTPFVRNHFFEQEFYDLQRVEVLRGPQGTLYGRNATAGVVNIISAKPKFMVEAKASVDISNYSSTRVEGMVNVPLVEDAVALRLAAAWTKRNGYVTNEITGNPIDGRDLWSTRVSLRVAPSDAVDMNLIWEHFEENDDRLRSGKQLCKKDVVTQVGDVAVTSFDQRLVTAGIQAPWIRVQPRFSQGCVRESLYSPASFQTPNGASVPYYLPLGAIGNFPTTLDPYVSQTQSRDLRVIESTVDPDYQAKADTGELQLRVDIGAGLTLDSETAYSTDFIWSTQDFNRFNTLEHAFCQTILSAAGDCPSVEDGGVVNQGLIDLNVLNEDGEFCDPQIGCSNRLVAMDLATANSRQFSQEFRVSSDWDGAFNFSLGANFLRYDTEDKYYVFINSLTIASIVNAGGINLAHPYEPGVTDTSACQFNGLLLGDPLYPSYPYRCIYTDPNPIGGLNDQGHNYFLSRNPYKLISYALFGETYYQITDDLKVTAGLRWTVDKKEAPRIPSWTLAGQSRGYPVLEVIEQEWREPTGRLAIDWKPDLGFTDETLLYASYAHGYKAGGANPPPLVAVGTSAERFGGVTLSKLKPKTFEAEFVDAFELGAKNTLADGQVTLNLAAFYYDYTGYQVSEIVDRSAFNRNFDATVWGLEIEADWRPLENLKLGFKGGYEKTRLKDGENAIDLMDRTAGDPDWVVVRPFPTFASSCILPTALFTHTGTLPQAPGTPGVELTGLNPGLYDLGQGGGSATGGCEYAYFAGVDPVTNLAYNDWPGPLEWAGGGSLLHWAANTYPGWNPAWAPNHGEGFAKELGGNELPNAPDVTATITVDYTLPLPNDWLATLHTDLYWQSESWWRVFNDHEYDKLDEYFTMNLAAIFTNEEAGWKVMAYVKNAFDRDSITGAFLNSDDTALTTNVFLTEPRLYGVRVTKEWNGGPLLGDFGARRDGEGYPLEVTVGGQVQRHDAPNEAVAPSFIGEFSDALNPLADQQDDLDWGDGREVAVAWRPNDTWTVSLGARFGKTNGASPWSQRSEEGDRACTIAMYDPYSGGCSAYVGSPYEREIFAIRYNYTISDTRDREAHTIIDFDIGRDVGIGGLSESRLRGGLRYADLESKTQSHIFGVTHWDIPVDENLIKYNGYIFPLVHATHDRYVSDVTADREFKGAGPVLSWEASQALLGGKEAGVLGLDWSLTGGVLFGKRDVSIEGREIREYFHEPVGALFGIADGHFPTETTPLPDVSIRRSESVSVPVFGASLGLSYEVDRFSIGAGYRWERYQDAIDGGFSETQEEDRTIDGPYFKVSVGFGG